jgi:uncharacterized oxidoreductase
MRDSKIEVLELARLYRQTARMCAHEAAAPRAMPLKAFITESMELLTSTPTPPEILVGPVKPLCFAAQGDYAGFFTTFNNAMTAAQH